MVDKNLFLHDLAVVAILKNEGHYLKEWLDYHLLAGVDHFYLYDNDSPDNQAEIAKPYVEAGLVDYFSAPGKVMQMPVYNKAIKRFKFLNRYMAFIDGDEFIYPKWHEGGGIVELVDEILSQVPNAAGLAINWQCFGSNGQEKADYSRGVLERFTCRAPSDWQLLNISIGNQHVKTIANPRKIKIFFNPHFGIYFETKFPVNENGNIVQGAFNNPVTAQKIVINHYYVKSREEYAKKVDRGRANTLMKRRLEDFYLHDRNEVFDDSILKYRATRAENFTLKSNAERINRVTEVLTEKLSAYVSGEKFSIETALTCRALSTYLREKFPHDAEYWKICEEASLSAILNSLNGINMLEAMIFIRELPNILMLPYPGIAEINRAALQIISQMKDFYRLNGHWKEFTDLDYIQELLRGVSFDGR
ncbi:MAG: glycosyltransferase family 2 protein [Selenomonadaceae bacterium]|nr:glycosyltransferase family 2 protein [Selenomonadaceae bacterium]